MRKAYESDGIVLYNGDAIEMLKGIPDESVDLICTDPPYRCSRRNGGGFRIEWMNDGKCFDHNSIEPEEWMPQIYRVLKNGTHCYIMTNQLNLPRMINVAMAVGFHWLKALVWVKGVKLMSHHYMNQFEYILMFRKGSDKIINFPGMSDVITTPNFRKLKGMDGKNLHNTEKPMQLMRILIENSTKEGEVVLDPFAGIGSTAIAAKALGRKCIACEIDETYCSVTTKRLDETEIEARQLTLF